jgi:hypothetical protein
MHAPDLVRNRTTSPTDSTWVCVPPRSRTVRHHAIEQTQLQRHGGSHCSLQSHAVQRARQALRAEHGAVVFVRRPATGRRRGAGPGDHQTPRGAAARRLVRLRRLAQIRRGHSVSGRARSRRAPRRQRLPFRKVGAETPRRHSRRGRGRHLVGRVRHVRRVLAGPLAGTRVRLCVAQAAARLGAGRLLPGVPREGLGA